MTSVADPAAAQPRAVRQARQGLSRAVLVDRAPARRPITLAAPVAAGWAVLFGLIAVSLPVVLAWVVSPALDSTWEQALRASAAAWLAVGLVPVGIGSVTLSLLPLGFVALPLLLLWHATRWAVRSTRPSPGREETVLVVLVAAVYAGLAAVLAVLASGDGITISPARAAVTSALLAAGTTVAVLLRETDLARRWADRLPPDAPAVLRAAGVAVGILLAAGALLAAAALVVALPTAIEVTRTLIAGAGAVAGPLVTLIGLGYVPVAAVWGTAVLTGPGVLVGPDALVGPGGGAGDGPLPAFPLLAALPVATPAWVWGLLGVPVVAGLLAGRVLGRSPGGAVLSAGRAMARVTATGLLVAAAMAGLSALAGGSLGDDRLALVGPAPVLVAAAAAGLVMLGALAGVLLPQRHAE